MLCYPEILYRLWWLEWTCLSHQSLSQAIMNVGCCGRQDRVIDRLDKRHPFVILSLSRNFYPGTMHFFHSRFDNLIEPFWFIIEMPLLIDSKRFTYIQLQSRQLMLALLSYEGMFSIVQSGLSSDYVHRVDPSET